MKRKDKTKIWGEGMKRAPSLCAVTFLFLITNLFFLTSDLCPLKSAYAVNDGAGNEWFDIDSTSGEFTLTDGTNNLLSVSGATSAVTLGSGSNETGSLIFSNSTNNNTVTLQSGTTSTTYALTLPATQGGASTFLQNNGSGTLSWSSAGTGDILDVGDCGGPSCFNGSSGTTLTFEDGADDKTLSFDTVNNHFDFNAPTSVADGTYTVDLTDAGNGTGLSVTAAGSREVGLLTGVGELYVTDGSDSMAVFDGTYGVNVTADSASVAGYFESNTDYVELLGGSYDLSIFSNNQDSLYVYQNSGSRAAFFENNSTGVTIDIDANNATTSNIIEVSATALTTGDALEIAVDTDTLTTGQALNILGTADAATAVATIGGFGQAVFNESGSASGDFRIESISDANMVFVDASADDFLIGGSTAAAADIILNDGGAAIFNEQNADSDFRIEGTSETDLIFADASRNQVGVAVSGVLDARLEVEVGAGENMTGLRVNQTDTTNNPNAINVVNTGTGDTVNIDADGATTRAIAIDAETTTNTVVDINADQLTTNDALAITVDTDNLTTGHAMKVLGTTDANTEVFTVDGIGVVQTGGAGQDGRLNIYSEQGATDYTVSFQPHATMTANTAYIMPADDGDNGEFLQVDATGNLTWAAVSNTTPFSGTDGSVLYVNGTSFGEDNADFFYDDTNDELGIGTATPSSTLEVASDAGETEAVVTTTNTAGNFQTFVSDGTPETFITGNPGDLAVDVTSDPASIYIKENGTNSTTGWARMQPVGDSGTGFEILHFDNSSTDSSGGADQTLKSFTIPADTIDPGDALRVIAWAYRKSGSGGARYGFSYGTTQVVKTPTNTNDTPARLVMNLTTTSAGNQRGYLDQSSTGASAAGNATEDETTDLDFSFDIDPQNASAVWTCDYFVVQLIDAA